MNKYEAFKFYNKDVEIAVSFGAEDVVLIDMVSRLNIDIGIFTIDIDNRTFLGIGPSLFSSIINYGSVCSLYLFHKTNKKYNLFIIFQ